MFSVFVLSKSVYVHVVNPTDPPNNAMIILLKIELNLSTFMGVKE